MYNITLHELQVELARLTYKPKWTFRIEALSSLQYPYKNFLLIISFRTVDTYNLYKTADLRSTQIIPDLLLENFHPDEFAQWVFQEIMKVERHEAQEWFRVAGQIFDNPHKPKEVNNTNGHPRTVRSKLSSLRARYARVRFFLGRITRRN